MSLAKPNNFLEFILGLATFALPLEEAKHDRTSAMLLAIVGVHLNLLAFLVYALLLLP